MPGFDFPNTPSFGQVVTGTSGEAYRWDGVKWTASAGGTVGSSGGGDIWITDFLPTGQPDGVTDLASYFQQALDAAAGADPTDRAAAPGVARLIVPANLQPYIIGSSLYIPSNSHLVIEHGATLKLAPKTATMFRICNYATRILFELYGTLDGNSTQQHFVADPNYPATSHYPTTISAGIQNDSIPGVQANAAIQGGFCSHIVITGGRSGLITNFMHGTVGLNGGTNCDVNNLSMTNSGFRAQAAGIGGWRNFPFDPASNTFLTFSGTYVAATNTATLITNHPHKMVPGEEFITEFIPTSSATGTPGVFTGKLFIALPGTAGSTIVFKAAGGGVDSSFPGGSTARLTNWFYQQATITDGSYIPATGMITVTTAAPHQLTPMQMVSSNVISGPAATIASGIFQLIDQRAEADDYPPVPDSAVPTTLRYRSARSGTTFNVVAPVNFDNPTGTVTLTTDVPHGLSQHDIITTSLKTDPSAHSFKGTITYQQVCAAGTTGSTIVFIVAANQKNPPVIVPGGTVYGGPTLAIPSGSTIGVGTKAYNSGFDNCFFDQLRDIGPGVYGGSVNGYIRRCEISRCLGSGASLFSDQNNGRCVDTEISGNYIHDNDGAGVITVNFGPSEPRHIGTRIFNNYITGNNSGAGLGSCDGLDFSNNYLFKNLVQGLNVYGSVGEVTVGPTGDRVKIVGNTIRDPCVTNTTIRGSAVLPVTGGTYDNTTGLVTLNVVPPSRAGSIYGNAYITLSNTTGSSSSLLEGRYIVERSPDPAFKVLTFHTTAGLGAGITITGGQITPNGFGIVTHGGDELLIANNYIGDYQNPPTMLAAIGGTWGVRGVCTGNYYGPRINVGGPGANFPADMSVGAKNGQNFDVVTGFTDGTTLRQPFSNTDPNERFPALGVSVGYNRSGGRGESTFYVGAANASPGGFEFVKIFGLSLNGTTPGYVSNTATVASSGNVYSNSTSVVTLTTTAPHGMAVGNLIGLTGVTGTVVLPDGTAGDIGDLNGAWSVTAATSTTLTFTGPPDEGTVTITGGTVGTAIVTLSTRTPHGLVVGSRFGLSLVLGTTVALGGPTNLGDIGQLDGAWVATGDNAGTSDTTINFNLLHSVAGIGPVPNTGLDIIAINAGAINATEMDSGLIDTTAGTGGSLLAVDGLGNTRLSGALVHGAMQTATTLDTGGTIASGGTISLNPNTGMVLVQNSTSLAALKVVLPAPIAGSYQLGGSELEVRFQNPVGTLTMTAAPGASIAGPPTAVLSAGSSFRFVLSEPGNIWLPRLPDVSGTAPVGGPYLPLSGGAVTGATTFGALTTHAAGVTVSGGGSLSGTFSGVPTFSGGPLCSAGLTVTGTVPLAANNTNFGRGNTYVLSGSTLDVTKLGLYVNNNISGTTTAAETPGAAYIALGSANIAAGPASLIDALNVTMVTGGAAASAGGWNALSVNSNDGALATNDKAGGGAGAFVALQLARRASKNQGGTGLTPSTAFGQNWGMDIVNVAIGGATNLGLQNGIEINQSVQTGASVLRRAGLQISAPATHVNRGASWDNGILIGNALGAATYRVGMMFGDQLSGSVFDTDSTVIAYKAIQAPIPAAVADTGIDFNDVTFTRASLKLPLFNVGPTGTLNISTTYFTPGTTGLAIDAKGAVGTGTPTINAGGSGFSTTSPAPVFDDAYGGVYYGTVTGTAISAIVVMRQPIYPTVGSAPATLALTARPPIAGIGVVVNVTWNTTANTLALQSTTGGKITMPALQASTTYANDAAAATGGVAVGQLYRNGSAVQIRIV